MDVKDELHSLVAVAKTPEGAVQGLENLALLQDDDAEDPSHEGEKVVEEDTSKSVAEPMTAAGVEPTKLDNLVDNKEVASNGAEGEERAQKLKAGLEGNDKVNHSPSFEHVLTPTLFELGNDVHHASRHKIHQDVCLCNSIIPSNIKLGQLDYAITCFLSVTELLDEMPARDLTSWKTILSSVVTVSARGVNVYMGFGLVSAALDHIIVRLIICLVFDPGGGISFRCLLFSVHFHLEGKVDFNGGGVDTILSTTKDTEDLLGE